MPKRASGCELPVWEGIIYFVIAFSGKVSNLLYKLEEEEEGGDDEAAALS